MSAEDLFAKTIEAIDRLALDFEGRFGELDRLQKLRHQKYLSTLGLVRRDLRDVVTLVTRQGDELKLLRERLEANETFAGKIADQFPEHERPTNPRGKLKAVKS